MLSVMDITARAEALIDTLDCAFDKITQGKKQDSIAITKAHGNVHTKAHRLSDGQGRIAAHVLPPYESIRSKLQPGDLVLFRSTTIGGAIIRLAGNTEWSHVAIVLEAAVPVGERPIVHLEPRRLLLQRQESQFAPLVRARRPLHLVPVRLAPFVQVQRTPER